MFRDRSEMGSETRRTGALRVPLMKGAFAGGQEPKLVGRVVYERKSETGDEWKVKGSRPKMPRRRRPLGTRLALVGKHLLRSSFHFDTTRTSVHSPPAYLDSF